LVELMIRVAEGKKLPFTQNDIKLNGHAIEVRVCAEDTSLGFMPSSGRITYARMPQETADVRLDFGVKEGDEISPFYDSMIGKLIVHGTDRFHAIDRMKRALAKLDIEGVFSNIDFLESILRHSNFVSGDFNTSFVKKHYDNKFTPAVPDNEYNDIFIACALILFLEQERELFKIESQIRMYEKLDYHRLCVVIDGKYYKVNITNYDNNKLSFYVGSKHYDFEHQYKLGMKYVSGILNNEPLSVKSKQSFGGWFMNLGGFSAKVRVMTWDKSDIVKNISLADKINTQKNRVVASISGVLNFIVKEGDILKPGTTACTIEAMKMLNNITVESDCVVKSIHKNATDRVACGDLLIELELLV
jgi:propionyl-CoA carboxylase alpha chain